MKKIIALAKSLWAFKSARIIVAAVALIIIFCIFSNIFRGCNEKQQRELYELQGRYEAYQAQKEAEEEKQNKIIQVKQGEIERLESDVRDKNKLIVEFQKEDEEIAPIEIQDVPGAEESWEDVAKINAESSRSWEGKYWKSQDIIRELGAPILEGYDPETNEPIYSYPEGSITWKLDQKYLKQVDITMAVKDQFDRANSLLKISEDLNIKKDKKIARMKLKFTLASIGRESLIFAAGYFLGSRK